MIRSSRYDSGDEIRYSYVQDSESVDVNDITEQELGETSGTHNNDLLEGVFGRNKDDMDEKNDRVLTKIKDGRLHSQCALVNTTSPDNRIACILRVRRRRLYSSFHLRCYLVDFTIQKCHCFPSESYHSRNSILIHNLPPRQLMCNTTDPSIRLCKKILLPLTSPQYPAVHPYDPPSSSAQTKPTAPPSSAQTGPGAPTHGRQLRCSQG
ncbi:hypothetical protein HYDPIDRAFT_118559 [Hydnomerulius pinastri MD-312]|uniref:Uncharacterized protein n=1 Tax=Hydnomerulius pinastri MD-312 TaxID=994086 RepID=A0A0C9W9B6_9AGAM|nr:hypothetical protein HYDPIDRAFT_118559 [Hydnomerulius pinastri MD-312]